MISIVFQRLSRNLPMHAFVFAKRLTRISSQSCRLQNSLYFWVFKYARVVKQKVWNEAENRERDLGRLARFSRVRLLRHALPISLLILRKKKRLFCSLTIMLRRLDLVPGPSGNAKLACCDSAMDLFQIATVHYVQSYHGASNENIVRPLKHSIVERILAVSLVIRKL